MPFRPLDAPNFGSRKNLTPEVLVACSAGLQPATFSVRSHFSWETGADAEGHKGIVEAWSPISGSKCVKWFGCLLDSGMLQECLRGSLFARAKVGLLPLSVETRTMYGAL